MNLDVLILLSFACMATAEEGYSETILAGNNSLKAHSRQRRYIVFPKGSSLQLLYENTYLMKPVVDIFRLGMSVGLAWMLPHESTAFLDKKHKIFKRSVFQKLEALIQTRGNDGKHCVLRAICESGQRTKSKKSFAREILHRIFSVDENEGWNEDEDKKYLKAHTAVNQDCGALYPGCSFSIFDYVK